MNKIICYFLTILSLGSGDFSRESKQFKDSLFEMSTESNVAMSLVDALQNWADALEAQISMMRGEVLDLKTENTKLSDTVENLQNENGLLKSTLTNLDGNFMTFKGEQKADLKILSESFADFIDHFNDFSLNSHSNFSKVNQKFSSLDQKVGNLTEIDVKNAVKIGKNAENLMKITAENEALNANVQLLLYNASVAFFSDYERLQNQNTDLNKKIDLLKNDTISLQDQILSSLELVQIELSSSASNLESLNSSISHHLGKMEMNMTQISSKNEEMKQEIFQINGMVQGNVEALKTQANMSMELQEILHQTANSVSILRGNFTNSTLNFAISLHSLNEMSAYNSTLLQRGFFGLEKHFIEMKQKLFETQLQVVSVNSSTQNLGDLRGEVFNIGQVMANTTNLISKRFQDLSQTNSALQESLASLWNITDHLDAKVQKIHSNHSFVTGNFQNSLSDFQANLAKLQERNLNSSQKMDIFELGLKNLLNFSMDLDANVTILSHQTEKNEKNLTLNKRKIDKIYELYELQSERIIDNANIIKDNVTNLSVAANILEAELSRVASGFNGLKNALNRHISNTGNIEVNVQKLVTEGVFVKSELDSLR